MPSLAAYGVKEYNPTWVAHRYSSSGEYLSTISGEEGGAGAFDCPHTIFIDIGKRSGVVRGRL